MNTTRQETQKVHYMGSPFAQRTACGRYVSSTRLTTAKATPTVALVTCAACRKAMTR